MGRMRKFSGPIGSVSRVTIESQALKSNMLGDPYAGGSVGARRRRVFPGWA